MELKETFKFYHITEPELIYTVTPHENEALINLSWDMEDEEKYTMINPNDVGHAIWEKEEVIKSILLKRWIIVDEGDDQNDNLKR